MKQHWYLDVFRNAMWNIAKGILWILDELFKIINQIWQFDFFNNDYVKKVFSASIIVACSWLILKVLIELIMNYIVKSDDRGSPLNVYRGVIIAIVMMYLITPMFDFGMKVSNKLTDSVIKISAMDKSDAMESTISMALVGSMIYENEMEDKDKTYLITNWKNIDINDTTGGFAGINDTYRYSLNFFMLIVLSLLTICLLCFVAIQMAKRVMEIALFKIIGPFCCTNLVSNHPNTFTAWIKNVIGLFLSTTIQFVSLGLLLNMFNMSFKGTSLMTGVFLIIGALLFVINSPNFVNTLLGQNTGLMSAFGDMQSLLVMKHGIDTTIQLAKGGLASAVSVVPKSIGHVEGIREQYSNYKTNGSGTLGALGKTALSEISRPFVRGYEKLSDNFQKNYVLSKQRFSNPYGLDRANPYKNPYSTEFNPILNQYKYQNSSSALNNLNIDNEIGDNKL